MPKITKKPAAKKSAKPLDSALSKRANTPQKPLWDGPAADGPNGGVTQSLLGRYLTCAERFRVQTIEGLRPADEFNSRMEYGNMWHVCEEALAGTGAFDKRNVAPVSFEWENPLKEYAQKLCAKYRMQQEQVQEWYEKCKAQFPIYVEWWRDHVDVKDRTPLLQEQIFDVPYKLPSGRTARLRGKWDSVDLIGTGKAAGIYIQENKTKSGIDVGKIARQVTFDLQSMFYLVALQEYLAADLNESPLPDVPIHGVRYNVIKRSAHKSTESMLKKINEDIENGRGGEWFSRWKIDLLPQDIEKFKRECLNPVLENLLDDYEWWERCYRLHGDVYRYEARQVEFPEHRQRHFRFPWGVYFPLAEGGGSDIDEYLSSGSTVGLHRPETLFPELV